MKKLNLILGVLIGITILSCSSDDNESGEIQNGNISQWTNEFYSYYNQQSSSYGSSPILLRKINYNIENDKILNYTITQYNSNQTIDIYTISLNYNSEVVDYRETKKNNQLESKEYFTFNDENLVSENLIEYVDINGISSFNKFVYNYSNNNQNVQIDIFESSDGLNFEPYHITNYNKTFNSNGDMLSVQYSTLNENFSYDNNSNVVQYLEHSYVYSNNINHSSYLLFNSYGKVNYWLYSLGWSIYDAIIISTNTINDIQRDGSTIITENDYSANNVLLNNKFIFYFFDNYPADEIRNNYTFE